MPRRRYAALTLRLLLRRRRDRRDISDAASRHGAQRDVMILFRRRDDVAARQCAASAPRYFLPPTRYDVSPCRRAAAEL